MFMQFILSTPHCSWTDYFQPVSACLTLMLIKCWQRDHCHSGWFFRTDWWCTFRQNYKVSLTVANLVLLVIERMDGLIHTQQVKVSSGRGCSVLSSLSVQLEMFRWTTFYCCCIPKGKFSSECWTIFGINTETLCLCWQTNAGELSEPQWRGYETNFNAHSGFVFKHNVYNLWLLENLKYLWP